MISDKELAQRVVALGVGVAEDAGDYWLDEWNYPLNCHDVVRNPCVAMELMERCEVRTFDQATDGSKYAWMVQATTINGLGSYREYAQSDHLTRAIIEACVTALPGRGLLRPPIWQPGYFLHVTDRVPDSESYRCEERAAFMAGIQAVFDCQPGSVEPEKLWHEYLRKETSTIHTTKGEAMSFIKRELDRVTDALHKADTSEQYARLYAAQQALSWALDPDAAAAPLDVILSGRAERVTGGDAPPKTAAPKSPNSPLS